VRDNLLQVTRRISGLGAVAEGAGED
jgi:hypothetical protein